MKKDSKSVLNIKYTIIVVALLIAAGFLGQILTNKNIEIANVNSEEIVDNVELASANFSRENTSITSRSSVDRNVESTEETQMVEEVVENQYISIDEITISKDMDLTQRCGISKEDFKTLIQNTSADTSKFFYNNSDLIYDLCEEYEINEVFFCGLIAGESGWNIASNHRVKNNYISMMNSSGNMITYSSVEEGLEAAAKLLHNKYLTPGGSCYYGKTLAGVKTRFCPNSTTWVNLIYTCMQKMVK